MGNINTLLLNNNNNNNNNPWTQNRSIDVQVKIKLSNKQHRLLKRVIYLIYLGIEKLPTLLSTPCKYSIKYCSISGIFPSYDQEYRLTLNYS